MAMLSASFLASFLFAALPIGAAVPDVSAPNQDGKEVKLSELKGKPVLVYFYPKDDTPGCTKQACDLRDRYAQFQKAGIVVLGVSRQDAASHQAFRKKYKLPFDLLTDKDGELAKKLGVELMPVIGIHKRQSLLIGADGKVVAFFPDVDVSAHADLVLKKLDPAQAAPAVR
jgi:thioredoxin-dependent peroxiredoxin